ncbi:MAG: hypothetical protein ACYDDF_01975 [Thermoplasmatota archaeon]
MRRIWRAWGRPAGRRRRDRGSGSIISLIVAAVLFLGFFILLDNVTQTQGDSTNVDQRVLQDKADSSLTALLETSGLALPTVSADPFFVQAVGPSGPSTATWVVSETPQRTPYTDAQGTTYVALNYPGSGAWTATSAHALVNPYGRYTVYATWVGAGSVDVHWFSNTGENLNNNTAVITTTSANWTTTQSATLIPPAYAASAVLEIHAGAGGLYLNRTELRIPNVGAWEGNPDGLEKFGLLDPNLVQYGFSAAELPNVVDYGKLAVLRTGQMTSQLNGAPDYPDVQTALGLGTTMDFHLRTFPAFPAIGSSVYASDAYLKAAYVGDVNVTSGNGSGTFDWDAQSTGTTADGTGYIDFPMTITNTGSVPMVYRLTMGLGNSKDNNFQQLGGARDDGNGVVMASDLDTPLIQPHASATVTWRMYGTQKWNLGKVLQARLLDAASNQIGVYTTGFTAPSTTSNKWDVNLQPAGPYYLTNATSMVFYMDWYDGGGNRPQGPQTVSVTVTNSNNSVVFQQSNVQLQQNVETDVTCTLAANPQCFKPGVYTIETTRSGATYPVTEEYQVLTAPPSTTVVTESAASAIESGMLSGGSTCTSPTRTAPALVTKFRNCTWSTSSGLYPTGGDKYPDTTADVQQLVTQLCVGSTNPCTPNLNVLIIGSNVRQTALTQASAKYAIADWVNAGGTLIVLGSNLHNVEWLAPLQGSTVQNATGSIGSPDPTNPVLHTPEELAWQAYTPPAEAWAINTQYYDPVVTEGALTSSGLPATLALSRPGAFGEGTVALTSYLPYDLLPGTYTSGVPEGTRLLHNLLTESYAMLYVDYGPALPPGASIASDSRVFLTPHPFVPGAVIDVDVIFYAFH